MKYQAIWDGVVVAETDKFEKVEGNVYFPPSSIKSEFFKPAEKTTVCGWKGTANYYSLEVNGKVNPSAAWVYKDPKPAAANIKHYIAFWNGVQVKAV